MPTTLPVRSEDSAYGRKPGMPRATAVILLWAVAMIALTMPVKPAHTAFFDAVEMVLP